MKKTHYRTLWLSDIHLGNRDCKAEYLLSFLNSITVDTLYLVGDIVDMWQMTKQFRWPQAHNQVMHKFMQMSQDGTRVVENALCEGRLWGARRIHPMPAHLLGR